MRQDLYISNGSNIAKSYQHRRSAPQFKFKTGIQEDSRQSRHYICGHPLSHLEILCEKVINISWLLRALRRSRSGRIKNQRIQAPSRGLILLQFLQGHIITIFRVCWNLLVNCLTCKLEMLCEINVHVFVGRLSPISLVNLLKRENTIEDSGSNDWKRIKKPNP